VPVADVGPPDFPASSWQASGLDQAGGDPAPDGLLGPAGDGHGIHQWDEAVSSTAGELVMLGPLVAALVVELAAGGASPVVVLELGGPDFLEPGAAVPAGDAGDVGPVSGVEDVLQLAGHRGEVVGEADEEAGGGHQVEVAGQVEPGPVEGGWLGRRWS